MTADIIESDVIRMRWEVPNPVNGPPRFVKYQLVATYIYNNDYRNQTWNTNNTHGTFTMACPDDINGFLSVNYSVRAINRYEEIGGAPF